MSLDLLKYTIIPKEMAIDYFYKITSGILAISYKEVVYFTKFQQTPKFLVLI